MIHKRILTTAICLFVSLLVIGQSFALSEENLARLGIKIVNEILQMRQADPSFKSADDVNTYKSEIKNIIKKNIDTNNLSKSERDFLGSYISVIGAKLFTPKSKRDQLLKAEVYTISSTMSWLTHNVGFDAGLAHASFFIILQEALKH